MGDHTEMGDHTKKMHTPWGLGRRQARPGAGEAWGRPERSSQRARESELGSEASWILDLGGIGGEAVGRPPDAALLLLRRCARAQFTLAKLHAACVTCDHVCGCNTVKPQSLKALKLTQHES